MIVGGRGKKTSVRQRKFHDYGIGELLVGLEMSVVIEGIPTGIGDVVEVVSDDHAMSRIAEVVSVGLDHIQPGHCIQSRAEFDTYNTLRCGAVLDCQQRSAMEVEPIDPVERDVLGMAKPLELMALNIEYSNSTQVIRHEDVSTVRMHGRCLRRNKLIA